MRHTMLKQMEQNSTLFRVNFQTQLSRYCYFHVFKGEKCEKGMEIE